jgi:hypothetical protein
MPRFYARPVFVASLCTFLLLALGLLPAVAQTTGGTPAATLALPVARKVFQRNAANYALVPIKGTCANLLAPVVEVRCTVMAGGNGQSGTWQALSTPDGSDALTVVGTGSFTGAIPVGAGGWYQLDARVRDGASVIAQSTATNIGVGEVFITAGQSNAANSGETATHPQDDRVSAWMGASGWRHADDPQPLASATHGSPWPSLGDALVRQLNVPVGFLCVAYGGSPVADWLPTSTATTPHYPLLAAALAEAGVNGMRAVLWHQGEADLKLKTDGTVYAAELNTLIDASRQTAGWNVPWFIASASYVPLSEFSTDPTSTDYMTATLLAAQMAIVTGAQHQVTDASLTDATFRGPTTDDMIESGWRYDGLHFHVVGLREHGRRWADVLLPYIQAQTTAAPALNFTTPLNGALLFALPANLGGTVQTSLSVPPTADVTSPPQVTLQIMRKGTGQFWNGTAWTATAANLPTTVSGTTWQCAAALPSGAQLPGDNYQLLAQATDANGANAQMMISVTVAMPAPVAVTTPANGALYPILATPAILAPAPPRYTSLVLAEGSANDDSGNADTLVTVRLRRTLSNGAVSYWAGGANWDTTYIAARNERPAVGTFTWRFMLPTLAQGFGAGNYTLRATATDALGHTHYHEVTFGILDSYSIGGRVANSRSIGMANAMVTCSGAGFYGCSTSVQTNSAGYYSFAQVPVGQHVLTATLAGYQASPATQTVTLAAADVSGVNFTMAPVYSATGRITTLNAAGNAVALPNVSVSCLGAGIAQTALTNTAGYYTLKGLPNGSYTVTPTLAGRTFLPVGATLTINNANAAGPNFTTGFLILGRITNAAGQPLAGVSINCYAPSGAKVASATSDAQGYYRVVNVVNGTYQLVCGVGYTPETRSVTVQGASVTGQNFVAGLASYIVAGRIATSAGAPLAGVTVTRNMGPVVVTVSTNSAGYFLFSNVPNGAYTIQPSLTGKSFAPASKTIAVAGTNSTGNNFIVGSP